MTSLSFHSPLGPLTLFEEDGAIIVLEWGRGPEDESSPLLNEAKKQLDAYFDRKLTTFDLPLAPPGTDFQNRVWQSMRKIPYGETRTYGDLAQDISSGARPVGTACGRNPIPIIIPCHRVVASTGLGGYTGQGGLETKTYLLKLEGRH